MRCLTRRVLAPRALKASVLRTLVFFLCAAGVFGQTSTSTLNEVSAHEIVEAIKENCEKFQWLAVITIESNEDMAKPFISMHRIPYERGGTGFAGQPLKAEIVYIKTIKNGERWMLTIDFFDSPRSEKNATRTRDARRTVLTLLSSFFPEEFESSTGQGNSGASSANEE